MERKKKLLYIGTFTGSWVSDHYREIGFKTHFEVVTFDYRRYGKTVSEIYQLCDILMKQFLQFKPDIVFINKGEMIPQIIISRMKNSCIRPFIVAFNGDQRGHAQADTILLGQFCDAILINNKSEKEWREYRNSGIKKIYEYHTAADVKVFAPFDVSKKYDVIFIGGNYGSRFPLSNFRLRAVTQVAKHFNLAIAGGPRWRSIGNITYLGPKFGFDFSKAISSAKVSFGVNAFNVLNYTSNRTWISMATGVPFLCHKYKGINNFFKDGENIVVFNDIDSLLTKIEFLLNNDKKRKDIGTKGRRLIVKNHTYVNRSKQLLDIYKEWKENENKYQY